MLVPSSQPRSARLFRRSSPLAASCATSASRPTREVVRCNLPDAAPPQCSPQWADQGSSETSARSNSAEISYLGGTENTALTLPRAVPPAHSAAEIGRAHV